MEIASLRDKGKGKVIGKERAEKGRLVWSECMVEENQNNTQNAPFLTTKNEQ